MEDIKKLNEFLDYRINGEWVTEFEKDGKKEQIRIFITHNSLPGQLIWLTDGKEIQNRKFEVPHDWFDNVAFNEEDEYFIEYSDQDVLIFGELKENSHDVYKWRRTFKRIKAKEYIKANLVP